MLASSSVPRRASGQTRKIGFPSAPADFEHFGEDDRADGATDDEGGDWEMRRRCGLAEAARAGSAAACGLALAAASRAWRSPCADD